MRKRRDGSKDVRREGESNGQNGYNKSKKTNGIKKHSKEAKGERSDSETRSAAGRKDWDGIETNKYGR